MAQGNKSDYRLLPSFIASTRFVSTRGIMIYRASNMQLPLPFIQQIGGLAEYIQQVIVDLLKIG